MKITASELRLGNWLYFNGHHKLKVNKIGYGNINSGFEGYDGVSYAKLTGIPLTPEILIKAGFKKETKPSSISEFKTFDYYTLGEFTYNTSHGHFWIGNSFGYFQEPVFIHQLQNLHFAITQKELEISL